MKILRIYSLIITSAMMIFALLNILRNNNRNDRVASFVAFVLYLPMWYYLLSK